MLSPPHTELVAAIIAGMQLLEPWAIGDRTAPNRVLFGPHVTNLGNGRALSSRHVHYYARRAAGGCGVIVIEEASVHELDWPYERAPLASAGGPGWAEIADAVHAHGALAFAAIGHSGGQGSSAYSQRELWAPSRVPEVATREVPKWMEPDDIAAVIDGFASAARLAAAAGLDGVEVGGGQRSLVRQFLSGLTNHRDDAWGVDRLRFARHVLAAAREGLGSGLVLGLRLSCDELAPWAGITPEGAEPIAAALAPLVDYVVVVRGSIYTPEKERPDFHEPAGFNIALCRTIRAAARPVPVVLQGSVVDPDMAELCLREGVCDAVEMTRAQIADPDLGVKLRRGERIRPCLLCNQTCQVRDVRNPIVSCVGEPTSGHEARDPDWYRPAVRARDVTIAGAGPAGLECARVAAARGHHVRIVERRERTGGVAAVAGPGAALVAWLEAECRRLGVFIVTGVSYEGHASGAVLVAATGSRAGAPTYDIANGAMVLDPVDRDAIPHEGRVAIWDPVGGPIGVALAEVLGERAVLVTPDQVAGNELSRTGDLAPANTRLQQCGVQIERRSILRAVRPGDIELEDRFTGARRTISAAAVVDCGFRLPEVSVPEAAIRAGDCVAPRTLYEAVLEGRRAALAIDHAP